MSKLSAEDTEVVTLDAAQKILGFLGGGHKHIYVTRAATLEYMNVTGLRFEEARLELTERLTCAVPEPGERGMWQAGPYKAPDASPAFDGSRDRTVRARVFEIGQLLRVANITVLP